MGYILSETPRPPPSQGLPPPPLAWMGQAGAPPWWWQWTVPARPGPCVNKQTRQWCQKNQNAEVLILCTGLTQSTPKHRGSVKAMPKARQRPGWVAERVERRCRGAGTLFVGLRAEPGEAVIIGKAPGGGRECLPQKPAPWKNEGVVGPPTHHPSAPKYK